MNISVSAINLSASVLQPNIGNIFEVSGTAITVVVPDYDKIQTSRFADYEDQYSMGNGTNMPNGYIRKCDSCYDNERRMFDNLITEAYNFFGVCMNYYVTTYDTSYDPIFGEDNDRCFSRTFEFQGYYTLPREEKMWTKFGIDNLDEFSIFIAKLHFRDASTFGQPEVKGDTGLDTYDAYIPKTGDIIMADYNKYVYEVMEVKEEIGMYLLSKQHVWELIVRPYRDQHLCLSATTSASFPELSAITNVDPDVFDISPVVSADVSAINYDPKDGECPSEDPYAGW